VVVADDFLARWSRRKRGSEPEPETPRGVHATPGPASDMPAGTSGDTPEAGETEAELLARLGLRHPDEMTRGDDFAAFLRAEVPRHLRTLALRRLWRSDPAFACLDGLNDYDGDFTGGGVQAGTLRTSYEVGRGILRKVAEVAEDAAAGPDLPQVPEEQPAENGTASAVDAPAEPIEEPVERTDPPAETPPVRATRRRMVFKSPDSRQQG
jgi:hypothetical protein